MVNKKRINFLNKIFHNYQDMQKLCNLACNNPDEAIKLIDKVIKYAFVINNYDFLSIRDFKEKLSDIDDIEIDLSKLKGLKLPSIEYIKSICNDNIKINNYHLMKEKRREEKLKELKGFEETAFSYLTEEIIFLDENFNYDGSNLTGDILKDFKSLYNSYYPDSYLLKESFAENKEKIISSKDIYLTKKGSLYTIESGRHRLLYLLARGGGVYLQAKVFKRIENKEFNKVLLDLQNKIPLEVIKDNPISDDEKILILYNNNLYLINNFEDLLLFSKLKDNYPVFSHYNKGIIVKEIVNNYLLEIINFCYRENLDILSLSFSDLLIALKIEPNPSLYEAYLLYSFKENEKYLMESLKELDKKILNR